MKNSTLKAIFAAVLFVALQNTALVASGGTMCDQANAKAERKAKPIISAIERTDDLVKRICLTAEVGIITEWALRQCARDQQLSSAERASVRNSLSQVVSSNKSTLKSARDMRDGGGRCPLSGSRWTGLTY